MSLDITRFAFLLGDSGDYGPFKYLQQNGRPLYRLDRLRLAAEIMVCVGESLVDDPSSPDDADQGRNLTGFVVQIRKYLAECRFESAERELGWAREELERTREIAAREGGRRDA